MAPAFEFGGRVLGVRYTGRSHQSVRVDGSGRSNLPGNIEPDRGPALPSIRASGRLEVDEGADADGEGAGRRAHLGRLLVAVFEQAVDLHARAHGIGGREGDDVAGLAAVDVEEDLVVVAARPVDADGPGVHRVRGADPERLLVAFGEGGLAPAREVAADG